MEEFNIKERKKEDISILYLEGYLDAHTSIELEKQFEKLVNEKRYNIVINFEKLSYISSAGLGVFMAYIENIRKENGDMKLCSMNEKIFNIFDMLGFPILFEIVNDEAMAINKFEKR
jgi:anti-sigma B factor antagonist